MKQSIKFSVTLLVLIVSFGIVSALYLYSDDPQCANGFPEEGVGIACQEKFRGDTCPEDILESTKDTARMRAREDALEDAKETCSHMNCDCSTVSP